MAIEVTVKGEGISFDVSVVPRASKTEVIGERSGVMKIRLRSPPLDGAANAELIRLLSESFKVPKRNIEIVRGLSSRQKRIRIEGVTVDSFKSFIAGSKA